MMMVMTMHCNGDGDGDVDNSNNLQAVGDDGDKTIDGDDALLR